ncbi:MAG: hypothetical protein U0793_34595 [Gemmataceae bacterium]
MAKSANQVCEEYAAKRAKVAIRLLGEDTVVIEGNEQGLRFLGELLLAQAASSDCGVQLGPKVAGKRFFSTGKSLALYVHRIHRRSATAEPGGGAT